MTSQQGRRQRTGSRERGASLVEFALILPLFAMILFGGITAGLALNEKQQITHATREGARYAAAIAADQEFDTNNDGVLTAADKKWAFVVRDLIIERSAGSLNEADICVSLITGSSASTIYPFKVITPATTYSTNAGGAACITPQDYPATASDDGLRVQVTARRPAQIDLIVFGKYDVMLETAATARSEDDL